MDKSLAALCRDYVWAVLVGMNVPGYTYKSDPELARIHGQISLMFMCDPHVGFLGWALSNLEKSAGLPEKQPDCEEWETVARKCGDRLRDNLIVAYGKPDGNGIVEVDVDDPYEPVDDEWDSLYSGYLGPDDHDSDLYLDDIDPDEDDEV